MPPTTVRQPAKSAGQKHTILVADDDQAMRRVLTDALTDAGFVVWAAVDGVQALEVALRKHPDLILLDIQMPKLDGLGMLKTLRQDPWGADAMVMLLTHLTSNEKVAEAMSYGAYDYLIKANWDLDDIIKQITKRLEPR